MELYEINIWSMIKTVIRDVYPVSFIMIILISVMYTLVSMTWRPYIRELHAQLERIQFAKLGNRDV